MMPLPRTSIYLKAALLAAVPSLLTGCANNFVTTAKSGSSITLTSISGKMHGGSQPILGATVNLYAAGTTGYGSKGTLLATTTSSATDSSFSFTQVATQPTTLSSSYACPSGNSLIYLIGSGGNTQGTGTANNLDSVLMAALGNCTAAGTVFVNINEVTTAASVFALAQYINPTGGVNGATTIGTASDYTVASPTQSGQGLINQFALVPLLVDFASGNATTSFTQNGAAAGVSAVSVTATPESAKINTIADILASCVNQVSATSDTNCSTLFTNATAPAPAVTSQPGATFNTAVDTLQATYYMATNPTDGSVSNLTNLYDLAPAKSPFQTQLTAQPTDWTIGLAYSSGATTCSNNGAGTGSLFINDSYGISIDAGGNVWLANGGGATSALTEISALGVPQACSSFVSGARGGASIDTGGNVWITSNTVANIYKYVPGSGTTVTIPIAGANGYGTAADGSGNLFFDEVATGTIYELPSTATATSTPTTVCTVAKNGTGLAVDTKGTVFVANNNNAAAYFCPLTNTGGTAYSGSAAQSVTGSASFTTPYGVAIDGSGNAIYSNSGSAGAASQNALTKLTPKYTTGSPQTVSATASILSATGTGGLSTPRQLSIDGAGNVWAADNGANQLTEVTSSGTALSGGTGFAKSSSYLSGPRAIAVDFSGNVWVTATSSVSGTLLTEIIGASVPVVTPLSAQLSGAKVATKP